MRLPLVGLAFNQLDLAAIQTNQMLPRRAQVSYLGDYPNNVPFEMSQNTL